MEELKRIPDVLPFSRESLLLLSYLLWQDRVKDEEIRKTLSLHREEIEKAKRELADAGLLIAGEGGLQVHLSRLVQVLEKEVHYE